MKFVSLVREIFCQRGEAQGTHWTFLQNFFTFLQGFECQGGTHRNANDPENYFSLAQTKILCRKIATLRITSLHVALEGF